MKTKTVLPKRMGRPVTTDGVTVSYYLPKDMVEWLRKYKPREAGAFLAELFRKELERKNV